MQEAPKRKQEDKQVCVPVTIRILQDTLDRKGDAEEALIHGAHSTEASIVQLVGVVESLVEQAAMLEFQLNDASGRMKVRYYGSGVKGVSVGRYVSIVGNLRTSPVPHVSAMCLQEVISANDISYHMIEVALAALRLRNPSLAAHLRASTGPRPAVDPITPAKAPQVLAMGGASELSPPKADAPPKVEAQVAVQPAIAQTTPPKLEDKDEERKRHLEEIKESAQDIKKAKAEDGSMKKEEEKLEKTENVEKTDTEQKEKKDKKDKKDKSEKKEKKHKDEKKKDKKEKKHKREASDDEMLG